MGSIPSNLSAELQEAYDTLIMPVNTNISLSSVELSDENKKKIEEFTTELAHTQMLLAYRLLPMNRLLFYGDTGCGKTYLGKALSNHLDYGMLYVNIAQALSVGNVAVNLSNIFRIADTGKYIIFLDECDSIAWNRDADSADSGSVRRATNSLFQLMDQMKPDTIVICATNMLKRLDPAFERRFSMKLEFRRPKELMKTIGRFVFKEFTLINDVDITTEEIVSGRTKMSYYEIQGIVERAMKKAVMHGTTLIKTSEIFGDIAVAMKIKIRFRTNEDMPDAFP